MFRLCSTLSMCAIETHSEVESSLLPHNLNVRIELNACIFEEKAEAFNTVSLFLPLSALFQILLTRQQRYLH